MNEMVATGDVLSTVRRIAELTEIRDPTGKVVGYFAPVTSERASDAVQCAAQINWSDLHLRKAAEEPHHTTAEVFEHLLSLSEAEQAHLRKMIAELKEREKCPSP